MYALGNLILRSGLHATAAISLMALASLLLPPLAYIISGVPVSLITLRKGMQFGLQVITIATVLTSLLAWMANFNQVTGVVFAVGIWLPVWLCSVVLREYQSQGLAVLMAGLVGAAFIVYMHLVVGDVSDWWRNWLDSWLVRGFSGEGADQYREMFEAAIPLMNAIMASALTMSVVITVLIGRWWQSMLFNPGGFRKEFYQLGLPRWVTGAIVLCLLVTLLDESSYREIAGDLLLVGIFMFLFQGIAGIHRVVSRRSMSRGWLVAMYCFFVVIPEMTLFVACVGMADAWMRGKNRPSQGDGQV